MSKLALHGGKPVRGNYLPYGRQSVDQDDIDSVVKVLKSDYLTTGPTVREFEDMFARKVNAKYAVAFSNGTAALHAACYAAEIKFGDEVITTPITFAASANCALYVGAKPIFADIDLETYMIDPSSIERCITSSTKAIIPVDFTGEIPQMDKILEIARKNDLIVIQDAAHSLGSYWGDHPIGSISDMTMFSLHPVKTITSGEGGIIVTNSDAYYERLCQFRTHGITRNPEKLHMTNAPAWYYEQQFLGYNYRITDIQCALGISQLLKLEDFKLKRNELVSYYDSKFSENELIVTQASNTKSKACRHLYVIRLALDKLRVGRNEIFDALRAENIGVNVHYIPVYLHPYYKEIGYESVKCINAEKYYNSCITLPLFSGMTTQDAKDVVDAIEKVLNHYRR